MEAYISDCKPDSKDISKATPIFFRRQGTLRDKCGYCTANKDRWNIKEFIGCVIPLT